MKRLLLATLTLGLIHCASNKKEESSTPSTATVASSAPIAAATPVLTTPTSEANNIISETPPTEWQGKCRPNTNEGGVAIKAKARARLQSAYVFQKNHLGLDQIIKSFADKDCKTLTSAHKTVMKCASSIKDQTAVCKNIGWEETKDGTTWKAKPMVDHAGAPVKYETSYRLTYKGTDKATLTSIGESGDTEVEELKATQP